MKRKVFICVLCILTMVLTTIGAFASEIPYEVTYNYSSQLVEISGDAENGKMFIFQAYEGAFSNDSILFRDQITSKDGTYTVKFKYEADKLGENEYKQFNGYIASNPGDKTEIKLLLVSADKLEELYEQLNATARDNDFDAFKLKMKVDGKKMNLTSPLSKAEPGDELEDFFSYVKANPLKKEKETLNTQAYRTFMVIGALKDGTVEDVYPYVDDMYFDEELKKDYKKLTAEKEPRSYFVTKLDLGKIDSLETFEEEFKKAYILTTARYGSGYGSLKAVLTKYSELIGITGKVTDSVCRKLIGEDYEDIDELKDAFDESKGSDSGGGSSGGGGGGGFVSPVLGLGGSYEMGKIEGSENISPSNILFDDLDGTLWASEAVYALADKGIINGKSKGIFAPNDFITREEFTKILVGAMGLLDEKATTNVFADVKDADWFCSCVNIAYQKGIVKGTGNGEFGTGRTITREDMVTMIYNALRFKGAEVSAGELFFEDADLISDYACEAVGALYAMGAVNGVSETRFDAKGNATRAQAAKVIYGVLEKLQ